MISDLFKFGFGTAGLLIAILGAVGLYKTFGKAGKPGIMAFIPIINLLNLLDIAGRPLWWIVLFLIPGINVVIAVILCMTIADRFGKSWLFGVGLLFAAPIFWAILGLGNARYQPALR